MYLPVMRKVKLRYSLVVLMASSLSAHAGLFDTLSKVNQVMNATRGTVPAAVQPAIAPNLNSSDLVQGISAMDCATLHTLSESLQQQLQAVPQDNQVSKTAGMLGKVGGLFASVAGAAGVNAQALQQASQLANHANDIASSTSTLDAQGISVMNQKLAAIRIVQQTKACQ